jgi:uncharacterized protein (TIGR03437 family)
LLLAALAASAHAPPTPVPAPPFHLDANRLVDAKDTVFLLRGGALPLLEADPPPVVGFRVLRQRWNFNAVRLPVSIAQWKKEGAPFLDRIAAAVATANAESLVAIVAPIGDTPLEFWRAAAPRLKSLPGAIFALDGDPAPTASWRSWLDTMQPIADAIRAAGAAQILAAPARDFQGFTRDFALRDPNVLYAVHTAVPTDFPGDLPLYAVDSGATCDGDATLAALSLDDRRAISWTRVTGICAAVDQNLLLWMTGDPGGFGTLDPTQIASAAGGFPGQVAPGEILSLYGQGIGPDTALPAHLTGGRVDTTLGGVQVLFDGVPAPILLSGYFQVNVQVPYELAGHAKTLVQLVYREVPSNTVELEIAAAAPAIFTTFAGGSDALALNADGTINGPGNPAPRGSIIAIFATGAGQTTPPSATGVPAAVAPESLKASLSIAGQPAEILYAGPAPTLVGVAQINARIPATLNDSSRAALVLTVGAAASRTGVVIWVR